MKTDDVLFTGTRDGLLVRLDDREPFDRLKARLNEKLLANPGLFDEAQAAGVIVDVGDRILTTRQLLELEALFRRYEGIRMLQIVNGAEAEASAQGARPKPARTRSRNVRSREEPVAVAATAGRADSGPRPREAAAAGGPVRLAVPGVPADPGPEHAAAHRHDRAERPGRSERPERRERETILIRRTLRSGQGLRHPGNVVVMGDVNPGAEVIAGGDVIVLGSLRGVVHAGATGDENALVSAFRLRPTQLRIAGCISRPPDEEAGGPLSPEIARVRDGRIVIEPYQPADMPG